MINSYNILDLGKSDYKEAQKLIAKAEKAHAKLSA